MIEKNYDYNWKNIFINYSDDIAEVANDFNNDFVPDIRKELDKLAKSNFASLNIPSKGYIDALLLVAKSNIQKGINLKENQLILKIYNNFI